jgi:exosortase
MGVAGLAALERMSSVEPPRHRGARAALPIGLVVVVTALIWPVISRALAVWSTDEDLHFGLLVPPLALLLVWWRRVAVRRSLGPGAPVGLLVVIGAIVALVICERLWARSPAAAAAGMLLWGVVVYLWGWSTARVLAFPIAWLTFGLALQPTLLSGVGFVLQHITAVGAELVSNVVGVPVIRDGLLLRTGPAAFIVAEACSGMNSLLALTALALLWLHVCQGRPVARLTLVGSVLPLVLMANVTRVALVLLVADRFGQDAAIGFFHGVSSLLLFGMALGGFVIVGHTVGCRPLAST